MIDSTLGSLPAWGHIHSKKCKHLFEGSITEDEKVPYEVKQSVMNNIAPARIIVTTHDRLIIIRPSWWDLNAGFNLFGKTGYDPISLKYLVNAERVKGRIFSTIRIHTTNPGAHTSPTGS